jgi:hypothetical protein
VTIVGPGTITRTKFLESCRGGDCIDLDFAHQILHCIVTARKRHTAGAPQERALTAVQFEQAETAMVFRALAL